MTTNEWSVLRVRGSRGLPALDGAEFLSCLAAIRGALEGIRWHHRWVADASGTSRDGLRIEAAFGSDGAARVAQALESRVPPPDTVFAEPLRTETDLDAVQSEEELDACLELLWRYSEFLADLRQRNPQLTASSIRDLTPGAFLTFVTGDRRHLETAMDEQGVSAVPTVSLGRVLGLLRQAGLTYRVPPADRAETCSAARIHHLTGCTFASRYYPFRRAD